MSFLFFKSYFIFFPLSPPPSSFLSSNHKRQNKTKTIFYSIPQFNMRSNLLSRSLPPHPTQAPSRARFCPRPSRPPRLRTRSNLLLPNQETPLPRRSHQRDSPSLLHRRSRPPSCRWGRRRRRGYDDPGKVLPTGNSPQRPYVLYS